MLSTSFSSRARCLTGVGYRSWTTCRMTYRRTWLFQHSQSTMAARSSTARVKCFHSTTASTIAASSTVGTAAWWSQMRRRLSTVHSGSMISHSSFLLSCVRYVMCRFMEVMQCFMAKLSDHHTVTKWRLLTLLNINQHGYVTTADNCQQQYARTENVHTFLLNEIALSTEHFVSQMHLSNQITALSSTECTCRRWLSSREQHWFYSRLMCSFMTYYGDVVHS